MGAVLQRADSCPVISVTCATRKYLTGKAKALAHRVNQGLSNAEAPACEQEVTSVPLCECFGFN